MSAPSLQDTLAELNELSQFFISAEAQIKDGLCIDMNGIEGRITAVCQTVQTAIPEQQKIYLPELNILLTLLDSCEQAVRMAQGSVTQKVPETIRDEK
ncbi:MAG: hypothetical protein AB7E52_08005 [Bdellovibrionales bacterium]